MTHKWQATISLMALIGCICLIPVMANASEDEAAALEQRMAMFLDSLSLSKETLGRLLPHVREVRTLSDELANLRENFINAVEEGQNIWEGPYEEYRQQSAAKEKALYTAVDGALAQVAEVLNQQQLTSLHRYVLDELWYGRLITNDTAALRPVAVTTLAAPDPDLDVSGHCSEEEMVEMFNAFMKEESQGIKRDRSAAAAACLQKVPRPASREETTEEVREIHATIDATWTPPGPVTEAPPPWANYTGWPAATTATLRYMVEPEQSLAQRQFLLGDLARTAERLIEARQ